LARRAWASCCRCCSSRKSACTARPARLRSLDRLIDLTIDYTRQRQTFGKPILHNQVVHFRLAELRTEVEALRALTYRAVEQYVGGKDVTRAGVHGQAQGRAFEP